MVVFSAIGLAGSSFAWIARNANPIMRRIASWWHGGKKGKEAAWEDYKDARNAIMREVKDDSERQVLISDLRQKFRNDHPHWADQWN